MTAAPLTALVVDDSPSMRHQVGAALVRMGFACESAEDGAEAWKRLATERFDLIVTDLHMPLVDGLKLVGLVRASGVHARTPILMVSAEGTGADRARAEKLGADAWLAKPFSLEQLRDALRALLGDALPLSRPY